MSFSYETPVRSNGPTNPWSFHSQAPRYRRRYPGEMLTSPTPEYVGVKRTRAHRQLVRQSLFSIVMSLGRWMSLAVLSAIRLSTLFLGGCIVKPFGYVIIGLAAFIRTLKAQLDGHTSVASDIAGQTGSVLKRGMIRFLAFLCVMATAALLVSTAFDIRSGTPHVLFVPQVPSIGTFGGETLSQLASENVDTVVDGITQMVRQAAKLERRIALVEGRLDECKYAQKIIEEKNVEFEDTVVKRMKEIITQEVRLYEMGRVARADYALESTGGSVDLRATDETKCFPSPNSWTPWIKKCARSANAVIQHETSPGHCWAVDVPAQVTINLAQPIMVEAFTVEHTDPLTTISVDSAPRTVEFYGIVDKGELSRARSMFGQAVQEELDESQPKVLLMSVVFDPEHEHGPLQTYNLPDELVSILKGFPMNKVVFRILDNHGANYTCIYRLRVHGSEA